MWQVGFYEYAQSVRHWMVFGVCTFWHFLTEHLSVTCDDVPQELMQKPEASQGWG